MSFICAFKIKWRFILHTGLSENLKRILSHLLMFSFLLIYFTVFFSQHISLKIQTFLLSPSPSIILAVGVANSVCEACRDEVSGQKQAWHHQHHHDFIGHMPAEKGRGAPSEKVHRDRGGKGDERREAGREMRRGWHWWPSFELWLRLWSHYSGQ